MPNIAPQPLHMQLGLGAGLNYVIPPLVGGLVASDWEKHVILLDAPPKHHPTIARMETYVEVDATLLACRY